VDTNAESSGRYHSNWLNMMYPRLLLARQLLREDGVIFISIDDNEVHHLRKLCDEVFGDDNFIGLFVINSSPSAIDYGHIAKMHDYVLFYAKNLSEILTSQLHEENKEFKYSDQIGPFNLYPLYNGNVAFNPKTRPNLYYPFYLDPSNELADGFYKIGLEEQAGWIKVYPVISKKDGIQRVWRWGQNKSHKQLNQEIIGYKTESGEFRIVQKTRLTGKVIRSLQIDKDISSRRGTSEVENIFGRKIFSFPKPIELIKRLISVGMQEDDYILDFFAGSGTTAHSVMELNRKDNENRKFILVQIPELIDETSEASKAGYKKISDITIERNKRVIQKIEKEESAKQPSLLDADKKPFNTGFKVYRLAKSSFPRVDFAPDPAKTEEANLALLDKYISEKEAMFSAMVDENNIFDEVLLKNGFMLNYARIKMADFSKNRVFQIKDDFKECLICMEMDIAKETLKALEPFKDNIFICLERALDTTMKWNLKHLLGDKLIAF
jgi:adenine-specific DNA-methyltransferase